MLWDPDPLPRKVVTGSLTTNEFTIDFVVPSSPVGSHLTAAGCPAVNGYALRQRLPVDVVAAALVLASSPHSVQAAGTITITGGFVQCTDCAENTTVRYSGWPVSRDRPVPGSAGHRLRTAQVSGRSDQN
jgi:hypothetical protein